MHLHHIGALVAMSDPATGTMFILSSVDEVPAEDWKAALTELGISEDYVHWDYAEANGLCIWQIQATPA